VSNVRGLRRRPNLDVTPTLTACCPRHPSCVHFRPVLAMLCMRRNEHLNIVDNGMAALQRPLLHQLHHRTELAAQAALSIGAASAEGSDAQPSPPLAMTESACRTPSQAGVPALVPVAARERGREGCLRHTLGVVWPRGRLHLAVVA